MSLLVRDADTRRDKAFDLLDSVIKKVRNLLWFEYQALYVLSQ